MGAAYECPLICFINARSGGRVGAGLALVLNQAIGRVQVMGNCVPGPENDHCFGMGTSGVHGLKAQREPSGLGCCGVQHPNRPCWPSALWQVLGMN